MFNNHPTLRRPWSWARRKIASRIGYRAAVGCLTGIAAIATMLLTLPAAHSRHPVAVVHIDNRVIDVGAIAPGELREVVCPIVNWGDRRLVVNELDRGCSCGKRTGRTLLVPPGCSENLAVQIQAGRKTGAIETIARFATNDPTQPSFDLLIKASVDPTAKLIDQRPTASMLTSTATTDQELSSEP